MSWPASRNETAATASSSPFHGKLHSFTIGQVKPDEADNRARQVDYLLMRLKQKLVQLPPGIDIVEFIRHDGNPPAAGPALPESPRKSVTLSHLKDRYLSTLGNGAVEANTLYTIKIHLSHACRLLGGGVPLGDLTLETLQGYVDKRAKEKVSASERLFRQGTVSPFFFINGLLLRIVLVNSVVDDSPVFGHPFFSPVRYRMQRTRRCLPLPLHESVT